jgi:hypothetical protein
MTPSGNIPLVTSTAMLLRAEDCGIHILQVPTTYATWPDAPLAAGCLDRMDLDDARISVKFTPHDRDASFTAAGDPADFISLGDPRSAGAPGRSPQGRSSGEPSTCAFRPDVTLCRTIGRGSGQAFGRHDQLCSD